MATQTGSSSTGNSSSSLVVAAAATAVATSAFVIAWMVQRRHHNHPVSSKAQKLQQEKGIILYRFDPPAGQPYGDKSCSPFGIKVETFLRLAGLKYTCPPFSSTSIWTNQKRKLPTCKIDGVLVADSTFILDYIMTKSSYASQVQHQLKCHDKLTPQQHGLGMAVKALCEDSLYWIIGYWRYQNDAGFQEYIQCNATLHFLPWPLRTCLERFSRKAILSQLWQQGMGRHPPQEVERLGQDAVDAIDALLDHNKKYLLGDKPSIYDATLFAMCSGIVEMNVKSPLKQYTLQKKNIMAYLYRINRQCGWN